MTNINIEKGDRVRAVSKQVEGDFAVFTVTNITPNGSLQTEANHFSAVDFDFELLQKAPKAVPTQAGIYEFEENGDVMRNLILTTKGEWFWLDMTGENASDVFYPIHNPAVHVQQGLKLVFAEKG